MYARIIGPSTKCVYEGILSAQLYDCDSSSAIIAGAERARGAQDQVPDELAALSKSPCFAAADSESVGGA